MRVTQSFRRRVLCVVASTLLCCTRLALGQGHPNVARGLPANGALSTGEIDTVAGMNGNLLITIPIGQRYPANATFSYGLTLVYNGQAWDHETVENEVLSIVRPVPARQSNAGVGWSLSLGRLNPPFSPSVADAVNRYVAPDGSVHQFYPNLHPEDPEVAGFEYTRDGSYLRLNVGTRKLEHPDGTICTFNASGYPTWIEDRFGNYLAITYSGGATPLVWTLTDNVGRRHTVAFRTTGAAEPLQQLLLDSVDLEAFGGQRAIYRFRYNDESPTTEPPPLPAAINTVGCGAGADPNWQPGVWFLTRVELPEGYTYDLPVSAYGTTPGSVTDGLPCDAGLLRRLRLPTLATIEWTYQTYRFPDSSTKRLFWRRTSGVETRTLRDQAGTEIGKWTYSTALTPSSTIPQTELVNQVVDPEGNRRVLYYSVCSTNTCAPERRQDYGLPFTRDRAGHGDRFLSQEIFEGSGTLRRRIYVRFENDTPEEFNGFQDRWKANQRLAARTTEYLDDGSSLRHEGWADFDGYGNYRSYQVTSSFALSYAETRYAYFNPAAGQYPGSFTPRAVSAPWLTTRLFDWDHTSGPSFLGQFHFKSYCEDPATGFLLRERTHLPTSSGATSPQDIVVQYTRDAYGNVSSASYFGGDTQALASPADLCTMALPSPAYRLDQTYAYGVLATSQHAGQPFFDLKRTIDKSTGLPSQTFDVSLLRTDLQYDRFGRLVRSTPVQTTPNTRDAETIIAYRTPNPLNGTLGRISTTRERGTSLFARETQDLDALGRVVRTDVDMPGGGTRRQAFSYNALGWATFVSEPGTLGVGTAYKDFDAFGRPRLIKHADSNTVKLQYYGVRQVQRRVNVASGAGGAEVESSWLDTYDHQGRLVRVDEPGGVRTSYQYDTRGRLWKVCQNEAAGCGQSRYFTYDARGFLTSESHPEVGLSGNGAIRYTELDARGHAALRSIAGNGGNPTRALRFVYDGAERVRQILDGSNGTVLKVFNYGTSNAGADLVLGKLQSAERKHFYTSAGANLDTRETYNYLGREGRPSYKNTRFVLNGANRERFGQDVTWNALGQVESQAYPRCESAALCGTDSTGAVNSYRRDVDQAYAKGWLTSVTYRGLPTGAATSGTLSYLTSGMLNTVTHGNGVVFTQAQDASGMLRPARLSAAKDGATLWDTGPNPYAYDAMGNVKAIGAETYAYDPLARLKSARIATGQTGSYSYDVYGNLTQILDGTTPRAVEVDPSTNRLNAPGTTHDVEGNVTAWSGKTYKYDLFNQMTEYVAAGKVYYNVYTPSDERFWLYEQSGGTSIWTLRDLDGKVLREYHAHLNSGSDPTNWKNFIDYTYRGDQPLAAYVNHTGEQRHFDLDHLGSVRLVTKATGFGSAVFTARHDYLPYGEQVSSFADGDRKRWAGHERDYASTDSNQDDLDYMHARHYNPRTGRFLSTDPIEGTSAEPQSWNGFAYVQGNPSSYTDPAGLQQQYDLSALDRQPSRPGDSGMTTEEIAGTFSEILTVSATGKPVATITYFSPSINSVWIRNPRNSMSYLVQSAAGCDRACQILGRAGMRAHTNLQIIATTMIRDVAPLVLTTALGTPPVTLLRKEGMKALWKKVVETGVRRGM